MYNIKNLERLQQLHKRIEQENTGTPKELASYMSISERLLYNLIDMLKDVNAPVNYSRSRKTYFYGDFFELQVNISVKAMTQNEVTNMFGGSYFLQTTEALQGLCSD